ncbi:NUDIX domain-containing protein [Psychrobacillus sp. NPDC096426]|uniref:NUDIX domain-containing protein n=1 Tax=Psychrobacillus sp. NPDC096426 TaxID=3364491 RepID=UPI0037F4D767
MIRKAVGAIVFNRNKFLVVCKTTINTSEGKQIIKGEWDFIKGGVEKNDKDYYDALLRELHEETGSIEYKIIKEFDKKIHFDFSDELIIKIGYVKQETTMFLVEFIGDINTLSPIDHEVSDAVFIDKNKVIEILTHQETRDYFIEYLTER